MNSANTSTRHPGALTEAQIHEERLRLRDGRCGRYLRMVRRKGAQHVR